MGRRAGRSRRSSVTTPGEASSRRGWRRARPRRPRRGSSAGLRAPRPPLRSSLGSPSSPRSAPRRAPRAALPRGRTGRSFLTRTPSDVPRIREGFRSSSEKCPAFILHSQVCRRPVSPPTARAASPLVHSSNHRSAVDLPTRAPSRCDARAEVGVCRQITCTRTGVPRTLPPQRRSGVEVDWPRGACPDLRREWTTDHDTHHIGDAVLALPFLASFDDHDARRAWKSRDWDALNRLHERRRSGRPWWSRGCRRCRQESSAGEHGAPAPSRRRTRI